MKTSRKLVVFSTAALALSLSGIQPADATTARRNALEGNRLIKDRDDVYAFPQLSLNYANRVGFDYGASAGEGSALLIMGDQTGAFGISLHRGSIFSPSLFPYQTGNAVLGDEGSPFGTTVSGAGANPGTIIDVFGGMNAGGGLVGARLALGNGGVSTSPANDALDDTSTGEFFALLQLGYSMTGRMALDTALNIGFSSASSEVGDNTPFSGTHFQLGVDARGAYTMRPFFDLGFLGGINFAYTGVDNTTGGNTTSASTTAFGIQAGVGPVWRIESKPAPVAAPPAVAATQDGVAPAPLPAADEPPQGDGTTIAAYGILSYEMDSRDPNTDNDNDATGNSALILPGFHLAADIELLDWLYFRSGAQYLWAINGTSAESTDGDNTTSDRRSGTLGLGNGFGWSAGLGIKTGDFRFDGTFSNNFLLNGPNFIGGGSGFLTTASAEYAWQ